MDNQEISKITSRMIARAQTGLSFIEHYLDSQRNSSGPDLAWLRSVYIVLSFHFEIILKSRLVASQFFKSKNDLEKKLKKVGHDIMAISRELGNIELKKLNIEKISLNGGEYIIKTTNKTIYINDFNDIRYDFIEGRVRSVKRDENKKIAESVEGARDILKKIIIENNLSIVRS